MSYNNRWEENGVYRRYADLVTGKELLHAVQEVESDPRFDSLRYVINDFNDILGHDVSTRDVEIVAAIDRAAALTNPNVKIAIVTNADSVRALAELYCEHVGDIPYECRLFTSVVAARDWVEQES